MTAAEFKTARMRLGLSQDAFADALGCHRRHVQRMEKGERPITPDRACATESMMRGEDVPAELRGSSNGSKARYSRRDDEDDEFEPDGLMTRGEMIIAGGLIAATVALFWWMARSTANAPKGNVRPWGIAE
jgi:transcriptional regulator with XRE-family HTH domain